MQDMDKMLSCEVAMEYLVLGSYSSHKQAQLGAENTAHEQGQTTMWLAVHLAASDISIQPLDAFNIPTAAVTTINSSIFFQHYHPEPDCYDKCLRPGIKKMLQWMGSAGTPMPQEKPDRETELFLRSFLAILHGTSDTIMREDDPDKLRALAHQAAEMRFFDHFQISIASAAIRQRKERNYPLTINFYSRALQTKEDDRLLFNTARTYYEMNNIEAAKTCLTKALTLNPELAAARQFLDFLTPPSTNELKQRAAS